MKSKASLMAMLAIAAGTLLGAASGCELIASVDRSKIGEGGVGGSTVTAGGGVGGTGATAGTGGTGGTGGNTGCMDDAGCPAVDGECKVPKCDTATGMCGEADAPDGTDAKTQTAEDCAKMVCTAGVPTAELDATDTKDDSNACTEDTCAGVNDPVSGPTAVGTACNEGANKLCDGAGLCVECLMNSDCTADPMKTFCSAANACVSPLCNDTIKNGDETATDCGGSCDPCGDLLACLIPGDCQSGVCTGMICQIPTCVDGVKNGTEGDLDCGAGCPNKCGPDKGCNGDADCVGLQCSAMMNGTCTPNCADSVKNNAETDADCGGGTCGGCAVGKLCGNADSNCVATAYCDAGTCAAKKNNGTSCMANNECTSAACADTVCCSSACGSLCEACTTAKTGQPSGTCSPVTVNTDPDTECAGNGGTDVCDGSGACAKAKGTACGAAGECATGNCVDGFCCENACGGACKACSNAKTGQPSGTCANVTMNTDPDAECVGTLTCTGGACSPLLVDGTACTLDGECANNHCVDGVCCNVACGGLCQACSAAKKGQGANGTCGSILLHTDPDNECAGPLDCSGGVSCLKAQAAACGGNTECQTDQCVDGVCCNVACGGLCQACSIGGSVGTCSPMPAGADPAGECGAAPPADVCNGAGACGLGASGATCVPGAIGACTGPVDCPVGGICP